MRSRTPDKPAGGLSALRAAALVAALAASIAAALGWAADARQARAADIAGAFDYYVLALSWNASWCEAEGDARAAPQCRPREDFGFTVHGLWPQFERGWPEYCATPARDPSRRETRAMADIMGSPGLALHQWRKHGRCSGLDPAHYFAALRAAWERIERPSALRRLGRDVTIDPDVVEAAFLEANPDLSADGVTIVCRNGMLREVRICLDSRLSPRTCADDIRIDCSANTVRLPKVR